MLLVPPPLKSLQPGRKSHLCSPELLALGSCRACLASLLSCPFSSPRSLPLLHPSHGDLPAVSGAQAHPASGPLHTPFLRLGTLLPHIHLPSRPLGCPVEACLPAETRCCLVSSVHAGGAPEAGKVLPPKRCEEARGERPYLDGDLKEEGRPRQAIGEDRPAQAAVRWDSLLVS